MASRLASQGPRLWSRCLVGRHAQTQCRRAGVTPTLITNTSGTCRNYHQKNGGGGVSGVSSVTALGTSGKRRTNITTAQEHQQQQQQQQLLQRGRRSFHSYDHPPPPGAPFSEAERRILSAAYHAHVPALGFSAEALARGARDAGYLGASAAVVRDGPFGLVKYHLVTRRERLVARAKELFGEDHSGSSGKEGGHEGRHGELADAQVAERVEALAWERLADGNKDVVHRLQDALAIMAQPSYVGASVRELAALADDIWFLAGDASVDGSWYAKRAALSAVYASAELFQTTDQSAGFSDTRVFLRRRLAETERAAGLLAAVGEWAGFTASAGVNLVRSKGVRI